MEPETISKNGASPKSQTGRGNIKATTILAIVVTVFILAGCNKDGDFTSPEKYIENPSVSGALRESGMPVYSGDSPPALAGTYSSNGRITNASSLLNSLTGNPVQSEFILSKQTASGRIDLEERVNGIKAFGSGGYITGDNGNFTIYITSNQTGSEAGLPDDVSVTVAMMMSGRKASNGNLADVEGLTVITKATGKNSAYDIRAIEGSWYKWKADFYLQTGTRSASAVESATNPSHLILVQKILQNLIQ
jgi:hypothetical protein